MKKALLPLFIVFTANWCFAQSSVSLGYDYFDVRGGAPYSSIASSMQLQMGGHMGFVNYQEYSKLHPYYDKLYNAGLGYFYFGDEHILGFFTGASGDKPFSAFHTYNAVAFYGYSVYSKVLGTIEYPLPNGEVMTFERKSQLYVGAGAASQRIFLNNYFIPVLSYIYHGELFLLRLGIPFNSLAITPSKRHKVEITINLDTGPALKYEFTPTGQDKFTFQYINESDRFVIASGRDREYGLRYEKMWLRGSYEHIFFDSIGAEIGVGYMPLGYYYAGYHDDFKSNSETKLPEETQYKIALRALF